MWFLTVVRVPCTRNAAKPKGCRAAVVPNVQLSVPACSAGWSVLLHCRGDMCPVWLMCGGDS
jgi:hypothetical protein